MCVLDNREVRKGWQPLKDAVTALFTKHGAQVLSARRWDERRLAYPINLQLRGTFLLTYFKADTQQVANIRRDMQFSDSVLRSLIVSCTEVPAEAYTPEAEFDVNAVQVEDIRTAAPAPAAVAEESAEAPAEAEEAPVAEEKS
jgi:ribosomal protein S6